MAKPDKHFGKWRIRWTDECGKRRSELFNERHDAVFALKQRHAKVAQIKIGHELSIVQGKTFSDLCDYWIEKKLPEKRSAKADLSIIGKHLRPFLGATMLALLGISHVDNYRATRSNLDPKTLSNHLTLLISMLNLAVELRWIQRSFRIRKPKTSKFNKDFRFLKSDDEIRRFLQAAQFESEDYFHLYAVAIYTGMRAGEIASLRWEDVDFDRRVITVKRSYWGPTKSGEIRHVPILDPLLILLRAWRLQCQNVLVCPNEVGSMHQPSARVFQEALHRVLTAAGFSKVEWKKKSKPYIRFHDLRHTFASHWVMKGGDIFKLKNILGHQSIAMTERYAHLAPDAFSGDYSRMGTVSPITRGNLLGFPANVRASEKRT